MNTVILNMVKHSIDHERSKLNNLMAEIECLEKQVAAEFAGDSSPAVKYLRTQLDLLRTKSSEMRVLVESGERFVLGYENLMDG